MATEAVLESQLSSLLNEHNNISPNLSPNPIHFELSSTLLPEALRSIYGPSLNKKKDKRNSSFTEYELNDKIATLREKIKECSSCKAQFKCDEERKVLAQTSIKSSEHRICLLGLKVICEKCLQVINLDNLIQISSKAISNPSPQSTNQLSQLLKHYLQVNNLTLNQAYNFQDAISTGFAIKILMKQISWTYESPHKTVNDFVKSLNIQAHLKLSQSISETHQALPLASESI